MSKNSIYTIALLLGLFLKGNSQSSLYKRPTLFQTQMETFFQSNEIDSILQYCNSIVTTNAPVKQKSIAFTYLGEAYEFLNEPEQAKIAYKKAISIAEGIRGKEFLAVAHFKLGLHYYSQNQPILTESQMEKAERLAVKASLNKLLYEIYQFRSLDLSGKGAPNEAIGFLKKSLRIAKEEKAEGKTLDIYNQLSSGYYSLGKLDSAIFYFLELLTRKKKEQHPEGLLQDLITLGMLYNEKGDYREAQDQLVEALRLAELKKDSIFILNLCTQIGQVYASHESWQKAIEYNSRAIEMAKDKKMVLALAENYKNRGTVYAQMDSIELAIEDFKNGLQSYRELNHKINVAALQLALGKLFQTQKNYLESKRYLQNALELRTGEDDALGHRKTLELLGELELEQNNPEQAILHLKKSLAISQQMNHGNGIRKSHDLLAQAFSQTNDYKKAFFHYKAFNAANDSIVSIENNRMINEIELQYKNDSILLAKQAEIEKNEEQIEKRNYQLAFSIAAIIFLLSLGVFLYFIYLKNKQLNQQKLGALRQEQKNQKLEAVMEGEERERKRLARDLHDGLGTLLATVKLQINALENDAPQLIQSSSNYQKAEQYIDEACRTIREISHNLMPTVLDQNGLEDALRGLCYTVGALNQINIDYIPFGLENPLPDQAKLAIYRITQELLRNVVKHAHAENVIVQLTYEDQQLELIVEDDGMGFNEEQMAKEKGIGLDNIYSRVSLLGGEVSIDSNVGEGTSFLVTIPTKLLSV